jgi:hypothetical protein
MADRSIAGLTRLIAAGAVFSLAACTAVPSINTSAQARADAETSLSESQADPELVKRARALRKTVLQGVAAGGGIGAGIGFALDQDDGALQGLKIGLGSGLLAGSYVALVQSKYITRQSRLRQIKSDLDDTAREIATTIIVMRDVLALQKSELASLKEQVLAGSAEASALDAALSIAQSNLEQMQIAVDGALGRQDEFNATRGLVLVDDNTSAIDSELSSLSMQIASMKSIAADLANEL